MQSNRRHLLLHVVVVGFALSSAAIAQNVADWTVQAPPSTVQLVGVKAVSAGGLRFTFKNVLKKTIVEFKVASPEFNGSSTERGVDAFTTGVGEVKPGGTMSVNFDEKDFSSGNQPDRTLRLEAVVYTDGSRVGSRKGLDAIEDEMLGVALETQRLATILGAYYSPYLDPAVSLADRVGKPLALPVTEDDARVIHRTRLPGIPEEYVDARLYRPGSRVAYGVNVARARVLADMGFSRAVVPMPPVKVGQRQQLVEDPVTIPLEKYRQLTRQQIQFIGAFLTAPSAP